MAETGKAIGFNFNWKSEAAHFGRTMFSVIVGAGVIFGTASGFGFDLPYPTRGEFNQAIAQIELNKQTAVETLIYTLQSQIDLKMSQIREAEMFLLDEDVPAPVRQTLEQSIRSNRQFIRDTEARINALRQLQFSELG